MSWIDVRLAVLDSPDRARSLFTVRAAISSARLVLSPRRFALALMCSYCRSRLGLDPRGMSATSQLPYPHAPAYITVDPPTPAMCVHACVTGCSTLRAGRHQMQVHQFESQANDPLYESPQGRLVR